MPIQRSTAMRLVSETEFKLVNESFSPLVGALSDKALMQRMERVRKVRDKYHALAERQRGKAQAGSGCGASSAELKDAVCRERIFEEALARFERQSAKAAPASGTDSAMQVQVAAGPERTKATAKAKSTTLNSVGMKAGVNTTVQQVEGKKTKSKGGAQGTSKASVKMANKAAAKTGGKVAVPKAVKGKGAATKSTPRGRHGAMVSEDTLR